jgi:hypothetical protein
MRTLLTTIFIVLSLHSVSRAQAYAPSAVQSGPEFHIPSTKGIVHYALTSSNLFEAGDAIQGGPAYLTDISGDLSYQSQSIRHPFSMLYAGGWGVSTDPALPSIVFQNLTLTQALIAGKWSMNILNSFNYLPYAPTAGLSGIPGTGDLGLQAGEPAAVQAPTLLTNYANSINDSVTGDITRQLDHNTYLIDSATWGQEEFLSGAGLNTAEVMGTVGLKRRLDARSSVATNYAYSRYAYSSSGFSFTTQGINVLAQHQWTRALSTSASVGPQWIRSSDAAAVPSRLALAASASASYSRGTKLAELSYTRGSVGGFGVVPGAFSNSIQAEVQEALSRSWVASITGTFITISGLGAKNGSATTAGSNGIGNTGYFNVQVTRTIGLSLTAYLSYALQSQSLGQALLAKNALSGLSQIVGTGISFRPQSKRIGQF